MAIQLSGSLDLTGSIVLSGSITTTGVVAMNGPITASAILSTGNITAQTLVVSTISSSVAYSSGSNIFGNNSTNRQTFTGSLYITGSVGIDAASSFRFNGVADISHAVGYDSTVDGAFLRGQNGIRLITGTGGGNERMRITTTGEACFACMVCTPYINSSGGGIINTTSNALTFYNSGGGGNAKRFGLCMTNGDTFKIYSQCDNGTTRKDNIIVASIDGAVGVGTTTTSTEANLFLGNQGAGAANEGGQLVLQKGTATNCATHLDNYSNQFRVLSGTDTATTAAHMIIDHTTKNACFYGITSFPQSFVFSGHDQGDFLLISNKLDSNRVNINNNVPIAAFRICKGSGQPSSASYSLIGGHMYISFNLRYASGYDTSQSIIYPFLIGSAGQGGPNLYLGTPNCITGFDNSSGATSFGISLCGVSDTTATMIVCASNTQKTIEGSSSITISIVGSRTAILTNEIMSLYKL